MNSPSVSMLLKHLIASAMAFILLLPLSASAARVTPTMQQRSIREVRANANRLPPVGEGRKKNIQQALNELKTKKVKRNQFCEKGLCITLAKEWSYPKLERSFDDTKRRMIISRQSDELGNRASVALTSFVIKQDATPKDMMGFAMTLFTPNADEIVLSEPKEIKAGKLTAYQADYGSDQTDRGRLVIVLTNPTKKLGHILLLRAYPGSFFGEMEGEFRQIVTQICIK